MHAHIQAAATFVFAPSEKLGSHLCSLLRLLCDMRAGSDYKWSLKAVVHPFAPDDQVGLRKVNKAGLFGYSLKQRHSSSIFRRASPPSMSHAEVNMADVKSIVMR